MMEPRTFQIEWPEVAISKLKADVARVALPASPAGAGWSLGCDREFLERFRAYWLDDYDWQAAQAKLNRYPQFICRVDGIDIHFVHVRGENARSRPLIMTHGWPGSHYEFWNVVERLTQPSRFGGRREDAFDLILPTLPGYGYSSKPSQPIGPRAVASLWNKLMIEALGYDHYYAQGGDWGAVVASLIALHHGNRVRGIHLNMAGLRSDAPPQNEAEAQWLERLGVARQTMSAYGMLQTARPSSLAWATAGNPLGQAAWILERFHDWSDLRDTDLETRFGLEHLTTNIMLYVMPESFASSAWLYHGLAREGGNGLPQGRRCEVPTGFASFPGDGVMPSPPRSRIATLYNLTHWQAFDRGGHFAAMEQPELFAAAVMAWGRSL